MSTAAQITSRGTFFARLAQARLRVLLLDYDGTISAFATDRTRAVPYPRIPEILDSIQATCATRLVLVTGRPAKEIPLLLAIHPVPEIWGCHGAERLMDGELLRHDGVSPDLRQQLQTAWQALRELGLEEFLESKASSVAVHVRGLTLTHASEIETLARPLLAKFAQDFGLLLQRFDGGLELRVPSPDKGNVVRQVLSEVSQDVPVAYLGDDFTDEDAFRALGARGLSVLVREEFRPTSAQIWLRPPGELIQFLHEWVAASGGDL